MPQYVISRDRKKRSDETLHEFYQNITLAVRTYPNLARAEREAITTYGATIAVQALRNAPYFQKQFIDAHLDRLT